MRKIKISSLTTYNECQREFYYDGIGLKGGADPFFRLTLDTLDSLRLAIQNNDSSIVDNKLSEVKDEWFVLKQEKVQRTENLKRMMDRYISFELAREKKIIASKVYISVQRTVNGELYEFNDKVDFIFQYPNGEYEAVKYKLGIPKLTSAARNPENLPENSVSLALYYEGFKADYPNIKISLYHLKHKDDKSTELAPLFNNKPNKNIVTASFNDTIAEMTLSNLEEMNLTNMFMFDKGESHFKCNKDNCTFCEYPSLCNTVSNDLKEITTSAPSASKPFKASKKQQEVINHQDGAIRVLAPAGSGKTGTIVMRYKNLIDSGKNPSSVLLLSFSNKAVEELRERIFHVTGIKNAEVYTYNSFCFTVVKKFKKLLGIEGDLNLVTRKDRYTMIVGFLNANEEKYIPQASFADPFGSYGIIPKIDRLTQEIMDRNYTIDALMKAHEDIAVDMAQLCMDMACYMREQMKLQGLISYADQIRLTSELFVKFPNVPKLLAQEYSFIIVDEFQDSDGLQSMVLYSIADHHQNICIVGDDDQSIYGWRGADVNNILRFNQRYPGCKDVILVENYRSTPSIVSVSSQVISKNINRIDKVVKALNTASNEGVKYINTLDYSKVADIVKDVINRGYSYSDISVISRKNSTLDKIKSVFEEAEIQSINYCNKLRDNESFVKVVDFLTFVLTDDIDNVTFYRHLKNYYNVSINEALNDISIIEYIKQYNMGFYLLLEEEKQFLRYMFHLNFGQSLENMYVALKTESLVKDYIYSLIVTGKIQDVNELFHYLRDIVVFQEDITLEDDRKYDAVQLITAHASKGKEYNIVIIPDINEFSPEHEMDEEERRTLYVALSRAKYELYILDKESKKKSPYSNELQSFFEIPIAN